MPVPFAAPARRAITAALTTALVIALISPFVSPAISPAFAQTSPAFAQTTQPQPAQSTTGTMRLIIGYPPGGSADFTARLLADELGRELSSAMIVNNNVPAKTLTGFITWMRAHPGTVNAASGGYGSSPHIALAGFEQAAGVTFNPVHYKGGGPAVQPKIHQAASAVLKKPDVIAKIAAGGMDATPSASPQIFAAEVAAEAAVLEKLMQTLGAKVD